MEEKRLEIRKAIDDTIQEINEETKRSRIREHSGSLLEMQRHREMLEQQLVYGPLFDELTNPWQIPKQALGCFLTSVPFLLCGGLCQLIIDAYFK
ncbi:hypothetical protein EXS74_04010 [Candidatus Woesearchaeota archaeon]|nr:hypothetical protein [Candidatus Woesearchaeota archaeon]